MSTISKLEKQYPDLPEWYKRYKADRGEPIQEFTANKNSWGWDGQISIENVFDLHISEKD